MLVAIADRDKQLGDLANCRSGFRADGTGTVGEIRRPLAGQAMDTQVFQLLAEALVEAHLRVEGLPAGLSPQHHRGNQHGKEPLARFSQAVKAFSSG